MKKTILKVISVALLMVCMVMAFSGCGSNKARLMGKWYDKNDDLVLALNANGTCKLTNYEGTYKVYDDYITIKLDFVDAKVYYEFDGLKKMDIKVYLDGKYTGKMTVTKG